MTSSTVNTVVGMISEFQNIMASVNDLEASSIYVVKPYAIVGGTKFYGKEITFNTWTEGVAELENGLKLYPNPTSSILNVEADNMSLVEVYNAMGQRVVSMNVEGNAAQVNTSALNAGVYFVRIYSQNGEMVNRNFTVAH